MHCTRLFVQIGLGVVCSSYQRLVSRFWLETLKPIIHNSLLLSNIVQVHSREMEMMERVCVLGWSIFSKILKMKFSTSTTHFLNILKTTKLFDSVSFFILPPAILDLLYKTSKKSFETPSR